MKVIVDDWEGQKPTKTLTACVNGDGKPIQAPSRVLCAECLNELDRKIHALGTQLVDKWCGRKGERQG